MVKQLTFLRVASDDPHAEVGEEGKYGECEDGGHWNDFNGELENCASHVQEVGSVSMGFCLIPLPAPTVNRRGTLRGTKSAQAD